METENTIKKLLSEIYEPYTGKTLGEIGAIQNIEKSEAGVKVTLVLGFPLSGYKETLRKTIFTDFIHNEQHQRLLAFFNTLSI